MDNIQFENRYEITKELVKSWNKLSQKRSAKHRLWMNFLVKTEIAVLAVLAFLSIGFFGSKSSVPVFSILVSLFIILSVLPAIAFRLQFRQFSQMTGETKWIQTARFGEDVEIKNGNTVTTYSYDKIRFIDENDECFCLFFDMGSRILPVYKNSFAVGSADEFFAFIKGKCTEKEPLWTKRELNKQVLKKIRLQIAIFIALAVVGFLYIILTGASGSVNFVKVRIGNEVYSTGLEQLDLSGKSLNNSDIEQLRKMKNLVSLDLSDNKINDISVLEELTDLTWLSLTKNQIGSIGVLKTLNKLTVLDLRNNRISNISVLEGLTDLTWLGLAGNKISDIGALEGLTGLTELYLEFNQISDIGVLNNLTNLTELRLYGNQISETQSEELKSALPDCRVVLK